MLTEIDTIFSGLGPMVHPRSPRRRRDLARGSLLRDEIRNMAAAAPGLLAPPGVAPPAGPAAWKDVMGELCSKQHENQASPAVSGGASHGTPLAWSQVWKALGVKTKSGQR